jgi:hypothetical protein
LQGGARENQSLARDGGAKSLGKGLGLSISGDVRILSDSLRKSGDMSVI